jgi:transposase
MISAVIERCAGIDVGKKSLAVCVMVGPANGEARHEIRTFGTTVAELTKLKEWIVKEECTHAVMESTGSYWKPVFNILEETVRVMLVNPHEVKARKGHKTDNKDGWWLAHLLRHAMITPSFIPPRPQRELRDLTRRRKKLIQTATGEKNRVDKMLQDANVKLSDVLTDLFGVSGQLMLEALLEGAAEPQAIAALAKRGAKKKIPQIIASLEQHQMREHHRAMIRFSLEHLRFLEEQLGDLDEMIRKKIEEAGYQKQWELLQTIPGVQEPTAAVMLAEVGPDVTPFASEKKLSSWAGVCPGNNRSAGKNKSTSTTQGNPWLKAALTESAWAVSRKKDGHLREKYWRIAPKNRSKAVVAVAHDIVVLSYFVLQRGTPYEEKRGVSMSEEQRQRLIRHHVRRLGKLGIRVRTPGKPAAAAPCRPAKNRK